MISFSTQNRKRTGRSLLIPLVLALSMLLPWASIAQNYSVTSSTYCISATGGDVSFTLNGVPPAAGTGTLEFFNAGDLDGGVSGGEYFDLFDENNNYIGTGNIVGQCTGFGSVSFTIPASTMSQWTSDGQIGFTADAGTGVNMGLGGGCVPGSSDNCVYVKISYSSIIGTDNASVLAISDPGAFCVGTKSISAHIANSGHNQISSVKVNWSVNGNLQTPVTYTSTLDTFGGQGPYNAWVTLGNWNFSGTPDVIKVWTSDPNGNPDNYKTFDTAEVTIQPLVGALSGTYTIGGSGADYATIGAAVTDLNTYGVCGPVNFNIAPGSYNERIELKEITGAGLLNKITFDGGSYTTTEIWNSGTGTSTMQTILLNGTDYVTFRNLTIRGAGATYAVGVQFAFEADHNVIEDCYIKVSTTGTGSNLVGISGSNSLTSTSTSGMTGNFNTVEDNIIRGGYYGIRYYGQNSTTLTDGNVFTGNSIDSFYYYGIYLYYQNNFAVSENNIVTKRSNTNADGLVIDDAAGFEVIGNFIDVPDYGLEVYYCNYDVYNKRGKIVNNMIHSNDYGLRVYYTYYTDVFLNTVVSENAPYTAYFYYADDADVRGNIFVNNSTAANEPFYGNTTTLKELDYNIYYAPNNSTVAYFDGTSYTSFATWQADYPQYNANSYNQDPGFVSSTDFHLNSTGSKPYVLDINFDVDIDGDARCDLAPTIGADESNLTKPSDVAVAGMLKPDTVFVNTPAVFESLSPLGKLQKSKWYVNGVLVHEGEKFTHTFTTTGQNTVKLEAVTCQNTDDETFTFTVITPTTKPEADFIVDKNQVMQEGVVNFSDLSTHGPDQWLWEISPATVLAGNSQVNAYEFINGTSATSSNPQVQFTQAGKFRVCLTATNTHGSDQECRFDYIEVTPVITLGSVTSTRSPQGLLYDDGGPNQPYSDNFHGGLLIDACASEVYLEITAFDMECGWDYLKVFDGADANGTPLHPCTTNGGGNFVGFTGPGTCADVCMPTLPLTLVANSGKMYIELSSDGVINYDGFEAHWYTTPKNIAAPLADISGPDSVCTGELITFTNESTGESVLYSWDFDNDLNTIEDNDSVSAGYAYFIPGTQTVTLIASNCGGSDTITKQVKVYDPAIPVVSFSGDVLTPTTTDIVTLTSMIQQCVDDYEWTFTRTFGTGTYTLQNNTTLNSPEVQVVFHDTGCWTVSLKATNQTGTDNYVEPCYIHVREPYCNPSVGALIADIGISRVKFGTIDNQSPQGTSRYQSFTSIARTDVEIGVSYDLEVSRNTSLNSISWAAWIDWNQDGDFDDTNEEVAFLGSTSGTTWQTTITIPVIAKIGPTVMRVGASRANSSNKPCGHNSYGEFEDYRIVVFEDKNAPVITLIGAADTTVQQGETYVDPGVIAIDNLEGDVTHNVTSETYIQATGAKAPLNTFVVRVYEIRYSVTDGAGNTGTAVRVVRVSPDAKAPVITVEMPETVLLAVDSAASVYQTPAVLHAEDNIDGDFSGNIQMVSAIDPDMIDTVQIIDNVDPSVIDTYTVTYYAVDALGNAATVTRTVIIYDGTAPVMQLNGDALVKHQIGQPYTDAGVSLSDNYYSDSLLRTLLMSSTNLNINAFGTYTYTYTLTDPSGNGPVTVTRTIEVTDTIPPVISLIGPASITTPVNELFIDQGVQVFENYALKGSWTTSGDFYDLYPDGIPAHVGTYTITYSVEDIAGNVSTIDRTVIVVDAEAPVIELIGDATVTICRWQAYTDLGYTLSDNYDDTATVDVTSGGTFFTEDISLPGTYSFHYIAEDSSGNIAVSQERYITVLDAHDVRCKELGIADAEGLQDLVSIYPNPNSGVFTVEAALSGKQVSMSIVNVMGQEVAKVTEGMLNAGIFTVDLSQEASGVYFLRVNTNDSSFTKRIVINK